LSLFSLVTVLLAGIFLHERLSARQALGVVTAVAGVALISAT
jgi:drug/metabolite transporter (DMT)-like permease